MAGFKEIDSPVQMRLYSLTKNRFVFVFVMFCAAFLTTLIIGVLGPAAIDHQSKTAKALGVSSKNFNTGPFVLNSGILTQFNQELWLFCQFQLTGLPAKKDYKLQRDFHMSVKIMGSAKDTSYKLISHSYHNRSRHLTCTLDACESMVIFHLGSLNHPSYEVNINLYGLKLPPGVGIRNVVFTFKYFEDQFTQIQIWFRFVFLVLSFTVTCLFTHSLRKFPVRDWCIEQRWMSALLPLLLLYNNPVFPLTFLVQSWIPRLFDAIFQVSFFAALLMFWLCAYHGIRQAERRFLPFYLPKVIIVGLIWATGCTILSWQEINEVHDPSYQYKIDTGHFLGLKIFFFVIAAIYLLYLLILLVQAFQELKNMPYFDVRIKFLTILMFIVVLISLVAIFTRFGGAVLQENFVMDVTSSYQNSAEFLAFYGLFNLYLYTMAYVYSPSPRAIQDATIKSVPSKFSMLGDSDEDVMFQRRNLKKRISAVEEYTTDEESVHGEI